MRFSIITVCWNSEKILPRAMASLSIQRFKDYEWVVVDGASTDGTLSLVRSFSSAPVLVVSEPDEGIYDAMNKGIAKARGEYIFFLNSDDALYDENVLGDVNKWLENNPGTQFLYGNVVNVKMDGNWLRHFGHVTRHNIMEDGICHQAVFATRMLFSTIGTFNQRFKINADYDWMLRVFRGGTRCAYIDRRVAYFFDGGAHSLDKQYVANERKTVRLQYIGEPSLVLRLLRARLLNRLYRMIHGHPRGALRIAGGSPPELAELTASSSVPLELQRQNDS